MAEVAAGRKLLPRVLGVVHQQVDVAGQLAGSLVIWTETVSTCAERDRCVIGHVGDRSVAIRDAIAEGAPALVRNLEREHLELLDAMFTRAEVAEIPDAT